MAIRRIRSLYSAFCVPAVALIAPLALPPPAHAVVPAPGVTPAALTVGTHVDLSGPLAPVGNAVKNGLAMAFDETNAKGGVFGRKLKLIVEDNGYDAAKARAAVDALLAAPVFAVLCPVGTPPVAATIETVLKHETLHLFPFTSADDTYVPSQALEFAIDPPVAAQVREGVAALTQLKGPLKTAVLYRDDEFGRAARDGALDALAREQRRAAAVIAYPPQSRAFGREIARLKKAHVALVVLGAVPDEIIAIAQAARARGYAPAFLCPADCHIPEVATLGGAAVNGLYSVAGTPMPYPDSGNRALRDWVGRYERRYRTVASEQAFRAYLDARLFVAALRRSGPHPTERHFARVLEAMPAWRDPDFDAPAVDFTARDHLGLRHPFLAQIRRRRWQKVELPSTDHANVNHGH